MQVVLSYYNNSNSNMMMMMVVVVVVVVMVVFSCSRLGDVNDWLSMFFFNDSFQYVCC